MPPNVAPGPPPESAWGLPARLGKHARDLLGFMVPRKPLNQTRFEHAVSVAAGFVRSPPSVLPFIAFALVAWKLSPSNRRDLTGSVSEPRTDRRPAVMASPARQPYRPGARTDDQVAKRVYFWSFAFVPAVTALAWFGLRGSHLLPAGGGGQWAAIILTAMFALVIPGCVRVPRGGLCHGRLHPRAAAAAA